MSYVIRSTNKQLPPFEIALPDFRRACKWLIENAMKLGGGTFEIWRVEKRDRRVTEELEAEYTHDIN